MCGRFTNRLTWREIVALYRLIVPATPEPNLAARYNICRECCGPRAGPLWHWGSFIGALEVVNWLILDQEPRSKFQSVL
jgi:hypothetical protein